MTNPRKKIILNEILFWKQNKLLPEHYCDFLAALYAEGEDVEEIEQAHSKKAFFPTEKRKVSFIIISLFLAMVAILSVYFFVKAATLLLTIFIAIIAITCFVAAIRTANKNGILAPVYHIIGAILLFSLSIKVYSTYFNGNNIALFSIIGANCIIWLWIGIKSKLIYFTTSGILGLVALIGYYTFNLL